MKDKLAFKSEMYTKNRERAWKALRDKDPIMVVQAEYIEKDLEHTLPETKQFHPSANPCKRLRSILYAVAFARADIGYVPIMNTYTAILILNCKNINAFNILSHLLTIPIVSHYINIDREILKGYGDLLERLIQKNLTKVYKHLKSQGYQFVSFVHDAIANLYVRCFPYDVVVKIWDQVIGYSEAGLFQVALGIFKALEKEIIARNTDDVTTLVKQPLTHTNEEHIFKAMTKMHSVLKDFNKLKIEYTP